MTNSCRGSKSDVPFRLRNLGLGCQLERTIHSNLVITSRNKFVIQVDNLEVAQFVYLLLNNERIRHVIDTITSKVVLILGRFTSERQVVLHAIREELRERDYLPVLFAFDKPSSQTTVETISTLPHMARFVIVDLTDAKSILQELQAIVPSSPSIVGQPLLLDSRRPSHQSDRRATALEHESHIWRSIHLTDSWILSKTVHTRRSLKRGHCLKVSVRHRTPPNKSRVQLQP
jgi:hypothetical protein